MKILEDIEKELPVYTSTIKDKYSENSKAMYFSSFITKMFNVEPAEIDMEVPTKSFFLGLRGRIDALLGHLILEFKKDLRNSIEEAKEELIKYLQSYHEKFPEEDYIGIATDGILFKVFQPIFDFSEHHEKVAVKGLEEIDSLDLEIEREPEKIFLWFDSYLFSADKITPTSLDIKKRFGVLSPTYAKAHYEILKLFESIKDTLPVNTKLKNWSKYLEVVYGDEEKEIDLFLRHTYLATLVKLIVHIRLSKGQIPNKDEMWQILHGTRFKAFGVLNFVEQDFFTWITYFPTQYISNPFLYKLLKELMVYDLGKIDEDVLKELYQELVEPEYRQLLGEFYTPDWLAQMTIEKTMEDNFTGSVLDPSCGSGTFLFLSIRYKIKKLEGKLNPKDLLEHILNSVRGFDIHPLAVTIAKTNYLLALGDLINYKSHSIEIPVYLSDSVKLPSQKSNLDNPEPFFEFQADNKKSFKLPVNITTDKKGFEDILEKLSSHTEPYSNSYYRYKDNSKRMKDVTLHQTKINLLESFKNYIKVLNSEYAKVWLENYNTLIELIDEERDSIWIYIMKNGYKPISLTHQKVDFIVGNPPWITMAKMKNEHYQNFLKNSTEYYGLADPKKTEQYPHMELASLFFCIVTDIYLKSEGKIGFVMPRSILVASHHRNFIKFNKPNMKLEKIIDCENVSNLFKVPCCSIIASKGSETKYPVTSINLKGKISKKNSSLEEANKILSVDVSKYEPFSLDVKPSDYYEYFYQGATIVPRNLYFVQLVQDPFMGINPQTPTVKSNEKNVTQPPWNKITIQSAIESNFLFASLLGEDVVPFGHKEFRLVVLPILIEKDKHILLENHSEFQQRSFLAASTYFEEVETKWQNNATDKSKRMTPYQRLNFRKGITGQNPKKRFKVLFVASSTYLAACIVDMDENIIHNENNFEINLSGFIAESKTYYFETDDENEAHYLSAILNSKILDNLMKPLQTRGLWGARDFHKRPLLAPIPKFNKLNETHLKLAEIGITCSKNIPTLLKNSKISNIGLLRKYIRKQLETEIKQIDELIKIIFLEHDGNISKYI
ncbi:MAG: N-6 DNA methylase [Nitrosarchaeum sp.]|nr:N-6 DNA methylase [Nitrosarchaeum sp.]